MFFDRLKTIALFFIFQTHRANSCQLLSSDKSVYCSGKTQSFFVEHQYKTEEWQKEDWLVLKATKNEKNGWFSKKLECEIRLCPLFRVEELWTGVTVPLPCKKIGNCFVFLSKSYGPPQMDLADCSPETYNLFFTDLFEPDYTFTDQELGIGVQATLCKGSLISSATVLCPSGPRKVCQLRPGDAIFALDLKTLSLEIDYVVGVEPGWASKAIRLSFDDNSTVVGPEQSFWSTKKQEWVVAGHLQIGDTILLKPEFQTNLKITDAALITAIEIVEHNASSFRLELLNHHTFIDAQTGLVLHNTNCTEAGAEACRRAEELYKFFSKNEVQEVLEKVGRVSCEFIDATRSTASIPILRFSDSDQIPMGAEFCPSKMRLGGPDGHRFVAISVPAGTLGAGRKSVRFNPPPNYNSIKQLYMFEEPQTFSSIPIPSTKIPDHRDTSVNIGFSFGYTWTVNKYERAQKHWNYYFKALPEFSRHFFHLRRRTRLNQLIQENKERQEARLERLSKEVPEIVQQRISAEQKLADALGQSNLIENQSIENICDLLSAGLAEQTLLQADPRFNALNYLQQFGIDYNSPVGQELVYVLNKFIGAVNNNQNLDRDALQKEILDILEREVSKNAAPQRSEFLKAIGLAAACIGICTAIELFASPFLTPWKLCLCLARHAALFAISSALQSRVEGFLESRPFLRKTVFSLATLSALFGAQNGIFGAPGYLSLLEAGLAAGLSAWTSENPEQFKRNFTALVSSMYLTNLTLTAMHGILKSEIGKKVLASGKEALTKTFDQIGDQAKRFNRRLGKVFGGEPVPSEGSYFFDGKKNLKESVVTKNVNKDFLDNKNAEVNNTNLKNAPLNEIIIPDRPNRSSPERRYTLGNKNWKPIIPDELPKEVKDGIKKEWYTWTPEKDMPLGGIAGDDAWLSNHCIERTAPDTPVVVEILEKRAHDYAINKRKLIYDSKEYWKCTNEYMKERRGISKTEINYVISNGVREIGSDGTIQRVLKLSNLSLRVCINENTNKATTAWRESNNKKII